MSNIPAILTFILGIIIATLFQYLLSFPLYNLLSKIMLGIIPKPKRGLTGIWEGLYAYPSKDSLKFEHQIMEIKQVGKYVKGKNLISQAHNHKISGKIRNNTYFTGEWENVSNGEIWHGSFQFILHHNGQNMRGRWVGFDSKGVIQNGQWLWRLVSKDLSKKNKLKIKANPSYNLLESSFNKSYYDKALILLNKYGKAWETQNPQLLSEIFTKNATYHERVFENAFIGLDDIKDYWQNKVVSTQSNIKFSILNIYCDKNIIVAEWEASFVDNVKLVKKNLKEIAVLELYDGKICSLREYWSSTEIDLSNNK